MALQPYAPKASIKQDPTLMYKLGYTSHKDANNRQDMDFKDGRVPLGRDYEVTTLYSSWVTPEQRFQLEEWFKQTYHKDVWTKVFYNGITECRAFGYKTSKEVTEYLYEKFPPYAHIKADGLDHVYFQMLKLKTNTIAVAAK